MSTKASRLTIIILLVISFILAIALYPVMPDPMPSHWNAAGEVNGYMSKFWGLFLMPLITFGIVLIFIAIPHIDPLRSNIAQFIEAYNLMVVLFVVYMLYIYILTLLAAWGVPFNMTTMLLPAMGLLFVAIGYLLGQAKRNFFIGIRTPWTLTSDTVWAKTHRLGKWMFISAGIVCIPCAFLGEVGFWVMMIAIMAAAIVPIVYSYILWKRDNPG